MVLINGKLIQKRKTMDLRTKEYIDHSENIADDMPRDEDGEEIPFGTQDQGRYDTRMDLETYEYFQADKQRELRA